MAFPTEKRAEVRRRVDEAEVGIELGGLKVVNINKLDGFKFIFEDGGWLLIRFSGTEPIIRVYCEVREPEHVQPVLEAGLKLAGLK